MRAVIETLADTGSVLELRRHFGLGMVTALIRIEGRPVGLIANNPVHLAGAIDSAGADKAARFMQLCDAFDIPLLFLCDTPGIMVGPEVEKTALVRHAARMFVDRLKRHGAVFHHRAAQGLWPRRAGDGGRQLQGGDCSRSRGRRESSAAWVWRARSSSAIARSSRQRRIPTSARRSSMRWSRGCIEHGKAVNTASHFEIDDVIDPFDSRKWIMGGLRSAPPLEPRTGKKRPCIDTW